MKLLAGMLLALVASAEDSLQLLQSRHSTARQTVRRRKGGKCSRRRDKFPLLCTLSLLKNTEKCSYRRFRRNCRQSCCQASTATTTPPPDLCAGFVWSPEFCESNEECADGLVCQGCVASTCSCDEDTGLTICTTDCRKVCKVPPPCTCGAKCTTPEGSSGLCQTDGQCAVNIQPPQCKELCCATDDFSLIVPRQGGPVKCVDRRDVQQEPVPCEDLCCPSHAEFDSTLKRCVTLAGKQTEFIPCDLHCGPICANYCPYGREIVDGCPTCVCFEPTEGEECFRTEQPGVCPVETCRAPDDGCRLLGPDEKVSQWQKKVPFDEESDFQCCPLPCQQACEGPCTPEVSLPLPGGETDEGESLSLAEENTGCQLPCAQPPAGCNWVNPVFAYDDNNECCQQDCGVLDCVDPLSESN